MQTTTSVVEEGMTGSSSPGALKCRPRDPSASMPTSPRSRAVSASIAAGEKPVEPSLAADDHEIRISGPVPVPPVARPA